jgi:putative MFS transporter
MARANPNGQLLERPVAFWAGALLITVGVLCHLPHFFMLEHDHMMAGMPMSPAMTVGMACVAAGCALAVWSLLPPWSQLGGPLRSLSTQVVVPLDEARLSPTHWRLSMVLGAGLIIDTMKPATLGFVLPGLAKEYGISLGEATALPFIALTGTTVGALLWGLAADRIGRRATILMSALLFMATSLCAFMPTFGGNMFMCFFMGASAGGLLPVVYTLMSESIPARHRSMFIVFQSGLGAAGGYLLASGAATLLEPHFGWRILWLLGLPTGGLLIVLNHWIPESPRYLLARGRPDDARRAAARSGAKLVAEQPAGVDTSAPAKRRLIFHRTYLRQTTLVLLYGLGWGLVNWGYITFLPTFMQGRGGTSGLLFTASVLSIPNAALAAYLYSRWSGKRSMVLYLSITLAAMLALAIVPLRGGGDMLLLTLLTSLMVGASGMVALLASYAAEVYPTALRATGSGLSAAATKAGGMVGPPVVGILASGSRAMAVLMSFPMVIALIVTVRFGVNTAVEPLTEEHVLSGKDAG